MHAKPTEISPCGPFFHLTAADNLKFILKEGLVPKIGPRSALASEEEPAVFAFTTLAAAEQALLNWLGETLEDGPVALIRIVHSDCFTVDATAPWEARSPQPIAPHHLQVISIDIDFDARDPFESHSNRVAHH